MKDQKKVHVYGFGWMFFKPWKELINREIDYCGSEDGFDVYEVVNPKDDDYGELYATVIN